MLGHAELQLNDTTYQIPRMAYADFEALATRWHDEDRKKLLATLEASGADAPLRLEELKRLAEDRIDSYFMVSSRCFRPAYAYQVIAHCAAKLKDEKPDVSQLAVGNDLCRIACDLCGIDYDKILSDSKRARPEDTGDAPLDVDHPDDLKLARPRLAATG